MTAILIQSYFCFENLVNAAIAAMMVLGLSFATDFWKDSVTHKFPDNESFKIVRELYADGSPALQKSSRITYGPGSR